MIWRLLAVFALLFAICMETVLSAPPPVLPQQPRPDLFQYQGHSIQHLNPVSLKAKATRGAAYRLEVLPGCQLGTIEADLQLMTSAVKESLQFRLERNDASPDFVVRINCGLSHIAICGSVTIFCLNRGFPYVADVDISDILSRWQPATRQGILWHEIVGHAIGTWEEQYCPDGATSGPCAGLALFAPVPGWVDFMGTGPLSRHGAGAIEIARWERTMYELTDDCDMARSPFWPGWWGVC